MCRGSALGLAWWSGTSTMRMWISWCVCLQGQLCVRAGACMHVCTCLHACASGYVGAHACAHVHARVAVRTSAETSKHNTALDALQLCSVARIPLFLHAHASHASL